MNIDNVEIIVSYFVEIFYIFRYIPAGHFPALVKYIVFVTKDVNGI